MQVPSPNFPESLESCMKTNVNFSLQLSFAILCDMLHNRRLCIKHLALKGFMEGGLPRFRGHVQEADVRSPRRRQLLVSEPLEGRALVCLVVSIGILHKSFELRPQLIHDIVDGLHRLFAPGRGGLDKFFRLQEPNACRRLPPTAVEAIADSLRHQKFQDLPREISMQTSVQPCLVDDVQTAPDEHDVQKGKEECWGGAVLVFAVLLMGEMLGCERIDWLDARQQEDDDDAKGSNHGRCDPLPLFGEVLQPIHSHELFGLFLGHPLARVQPKHGHATQEVADE
mmetsp:Transcript_14865/g.52136  ORF Transcript_14865/g.52136 Transcript_14865/m.52136 type:complete len:283 (-) Transcript_14865:391-1239(-)